MENKELLRRVGELGFPLLEADEDLKPNETIAEVVKSKNTRLWEGFPVIFANSNKENLFNLDAIKKMFTEKRDLDTFYQLMIMSFSLYKFLNLKFSWENSLSRDANLKAGSEKKEYLKFFRDNTVFPLGEKQLDPQRIKKLFENYYLSEGVKLEKINSMHEELSLEYALSQIFSAKQKEIFFKRLQGKSLTKTEREYFYRVVKKKAVALANSDLQRLAQQVIR